MVVPTAVVVAVVTMMTQMVALLGRAVAAEAFAVIVRMAGVRVAVVVNTMTVAGWMVKVIGGRPSYTTITSWRNHATAIGQ